VEAQAAAVIFSCGNDWGIMMQSAGHHNFGWQAGQGLSLLGGW